MKNSSPEEKVFERSASGTERSEPPPSVKRRVEPLADIPLCVSDIEEIKTLIRKNNSVQKSRHRLRLHDFFSHAFLAVGGDVLNEKEEEKQKQLFYVLIAFTKELAEKHRFIPSNTAVSKILHSFSETSMIKEGVTLIQCLLSLKSKVSESAFGKCFEERTITVALRLCAKNNYIDQRKLMRELEEELLNLLPGDKFKRRLFAPLFERAMMEADVDRALEILEMAVKRSIELWDKDYNLLLITIEKCVSSSKISSNVAKEYADRILVVMVDHHPVVGAGNARILARLLGGKEASVSSLGKCEKCQAQLCSFHLSDEQREVLLTDLVQKLVQPKIEGKNEDVKPSIEETKDRWRCFDSFKEKLKSIDYDTVIDGANVGYYGLSSWYKEAKVAQLIANKVDPSSVPIYELEQIPFPVDVAPKFSIIESMRQCAVQHQRNPLIVLHQRHLDHALTSNGEQNRILSQWLSKKNVLASPPFLNDDLCWLYAALKKPHTFIISNDQMRDHHFTLLSPRFFIRWRQRHRITFKALFHRAAAQVVLSLMTPRPYSVWVQQAHTSKFFESDKKHFPGKDVQDAKIFSSSPESNTNHNKSENVHWHIPFVSSVEVLDQASNRVGSTEADVDLSKDGDDECSSWICTMP